ncbi:hypothetical protein GOP47_0019423 [Adiantum capillus-veneris]|uniref:Uncharacterized protein n=1 Tax=Adiantum capillus-veneris TaxID=13818 RepID=A0A9D4UC03_ADICA|nr:hypothetical protein GOP47_0019423 [Adiantum capillus-veneris]
MVGASKTLREPWISSKPFVKHTNWSFRAVDAMLVKKVLGLPNDGDTKPKGTYAVTHEVPKRGSMHQVKDVADAKGRTQMTFYLQNVMFMAKTNDMSAKNYSFLKAIEQGERINWQ